MNVAKGEHEIGPESGQLLVRTYKDGVGAKLAHNLVLSVGEWSGTINVDPDDVSACSAVVTVDATSFEIVEATSGVKPLSDKDRRTIAGNINDDILDTGRFPQLRFRSTAVSGSLPALTMAGELTIRDATRPVEVALRLADGDATATCSISHAAFGMKPYSAMLGAIKLRDDVDIELRLALPRA